MILECASCRTRYRLDEDRVPESGLLVRCSRCGQVSRAFLPESRSSGASARPIVPAGTVRPAAQALDGGASTGSPVASTVSPPTAPTVEETSGVGSPIAGSPPSRSHVTSSSPSTARTRPGLASVPSTPTMEIQRLARVVFSDIEVYNLEKVDHALREGRFAEEFNAEMEEARRMIRNRFPSLPDAPALFDSAIAQICEKRRAKPLDA